MSGQLDDHLNKAYEAFNQDHDVLREDLLRTLPAHHRQASHVHLPSRVYGLLGGTIMRSRITKITAAAVIIIVVLVGLHQFGDSIDVATPSFADIIPPLLTVETGSFKMTINVISSGLDWINCGDKPVQTIEVLFSGPSRTRWNIPTGDVLVANMQYGKVMILMPDKMQAAVMQVGPPGVIPRHNRFNKVLELRRLIQYALETEGDSVEYLGEQQINGNTAIGYHITGHGDITIWANAKTKLPIQIEQSLGAETAIVNDITYDIELEDSLFSVEPPKGYSVADPEEDKQPSFVVRGTVTDAATGEPIAGAKVSDDQYADGRQGAITDSEGKYRYLTWPEEHSIKVEAQGYKPQRNRITGLFHAETEDEKVIDFALERGYATLKLGNSFEPVYGPTNPSPEQRANAEVSRFGSVIELLPEKEKLYRELHADVWPEVIAALKKANVQNFNIFLLELEGKKYLFSYMEYAGDDLYQDLAGIADDPTVREKWDPMTDACEKRLPGTPKGEQWKSLEMLMHIPYEQKANAEVRRFSSATELLLEKEKLYRELHADVWPEVIAALKKANVQNFNIFLLELEGKKYLFSYMEYAGDNLYQDLAGIANDPTVREKWDPITDACEKALPGTPKGEQWKSLEMLMHIP